MIRRDIIDREFLTDADLLAEYHASDAREDALAAGIERRGLDV